MLDTRGRDEYQRGLREAAELRVAEGPGVQEILEVAEWAVKALEHGSSIEVHWLQTVAKEKHAWARSVIAALRAAQGETK